MDLAVRPIGHWLLVEVWLDLDNQVEAINDLGEGLPLGNSTWPWQDDTG